MEVQIVVQTGTDIAIIESEYPDMYLDEENFEGRDTYFVGDEGEEWLTYDEAVECCGFIEGAIPGADTLIEGNGEWAQGMLSSRDFSGLAIDESLRAAYKARSDMWWTANERGRLAAAESSTSKSSRRRPHRLRS